MDSIKLFRYKIYNLRLKLYIKSEIFFTYLLTHEKRLPWTNKFMVPFIISTIIMTFYNFYKHKKRFWYLKKIIIIILFIFYISNLKHHCHYNIAIFRWILLTVVVLFSLNISPIVCLLKMSLKTSLFWSIMLCFL